MFLHETVEKTTFRQDKGLGEDNFQADWGQELMLGCNLSYENLCTKKDFTVKTKWVQAKTCAQQLFVKKQLLMHRNLFDKYLFLHSTNTQTLGVFHFS